MNLIYWKKDLNFKKNPSDYEPDELPTALSRGFITL